MNPLNQAFVIPGGGQKCTIQLHWEGTRDYTFQNENWEIECIEILLNTNYVIRAYINLGLNLKFVIDDQIPLSPLVEAYLLECSFSKAKKIQINQRLVQIKEDPSKGITTKRISVPVPLTRPGPWRAGSWQINVRNFYEGPEAVLKLNFNG